MDAERVAEREKATDHDVAAFVDVLAAAHRLQQQDQPHALVSVLRGRTPANWRTSMYYRYYHDPGDHNTRAHYGVRTMTHKLIYFWKKDQWELFDLRSDPQAIAHDVLVPVPHDRHARVLETQLLVLHCLCDAIDRTLLGDDA